MFFSHCIWPDNKLKHWLVQQLLLIDYSLITGSGLLSRKIFVSLFSEPAHGFSDSSEKPGASGEENRSVQGWTKTKEEFHSRAGRRKTRSERRKERRKVKCLRRDAQARREGGLLMKSRCSSEDEAYPGDPFRQPGDSLKQSTSPPQKKRRDETGSRKSRKSREAERWRKRGGLKRGYLYPHNDIDIGSVNLLSPKQRVRHRKRWQVIFLMSFLNVNKCDWLQRSHFVPAISWFIYLLTVWKTRITRMFVLLGHVTDLWIIHAEKIHLTQGRSHCYVHTQQTT